MAAEQTRSNRRRRRKAQMLDAPATAEAPPPGGGKAPGEAPPAPARRACLRGCVRGTHRALVEGTTCGGSLLLLLALASLGLFGFSCYLLDGRTSVGSGCDAATCVAGASADGRCVGFASGTAGLACDSVCTAPRLAHAVPFRFQPATLPAGVAARDAWLSCPFPRLNSNWRIPVSFFTGLAALAAVVGYALRWRVALLPLGVLLLTSAGLHFYLTIIDGDAVNKAALACSSAFAGVTSLYISSGTSYGGYAGGVTCDMIGYQAVCILDGLLVPLLVYTGCVLLARWRVLQRVFKEGGKPAVAAFGRRPLRGGGGQGGSGGGGGGGNDERVDFGPAELDPEERAARADDEARARARFSEPA